MALQAVLPQLWRKEEAALETILETTFRLGHAWTGAMATSCLRGLSVCD